MSKEHYTLEQVEHKALKQDVYVSKNYVNETIVRFTLEELHAFLNAAINELIGEPVAWKAESDDSEWHLGFDKQDLLREVLRVYTIQPLYALKELP